MTQNRLKTNIFRRFVIHILAVPAIRADVFDLPMEQNALIVCTDRSNRFIEGDDIRHKLILPFLDVEDPKVPGAFTVAQAKTAIRFLRELPESVTDLYICCSKGASRSAALAAAVLKGSGRKDDDVWKNPFYNPNTLVYRRMCRSIGLWTPWIVVRHKVYTNTKAFRKAQKAGKSEYERWQIIF